ncbi:unnamed protein product [Cylindrotheca closterium]|uniref:Uncharacterized protein n=1 Tax=Cylindrotheca closterium TaxID=2856 RepID=A0AAD2JN28_9STRA|nr:unnamed protein product [Cylindrotheca closterium]
MSDNAHRNHMAIDRSELQSYIAGHSTTIDAASFVGLELNDHQTCADTTVTFDDEGTVTQHNQDPFANIRGRADARTIFQETIDGEVPSTVEHVSNDQIDNDLDAHSVVTMDSERTSNAGKAQDPFANRRGHEDARSVTHETNDEVRSSNEMEEEDIISEASLVRPHHDPRPAL